NYFPYFALSGTTTTTTQTTFIDHGRLQGKGCFDKDSGPTNTCVMNGVTYTLRTSSNSSYKIRGSGSTSVDASWCGFFCSISGQGTGNYSGSYYTYDVKTG